MSDSHLSLKKERIAECLTRTERLRTCASERVTQFYLSSVESYVPCGQMSSGDIAPEGQTVHHVPISETFGTRWPLLLTSFYASNICLLLMVPFAPVIEVYLSGCPGACWSRLAPSSRRGICGEERWPFWRVASHRPRQATLVMPSLVLWRGTCGGRAMSGEAFTRMARCIAFMPACREILFSAGAGDGHA